MDIERLATSAVTASISETDYLSAFINSGDKEPLWDGQIYVYSNKNKSKDNLIARVPVQIKGKQCDNISKTKINYPINISDLRGYYNDGGVIFFVVLVKNATETKIFYIDLLPVKLKRLLSDKKTQTIELEEFPISNKHKKAIFLSFNDNRQKQASFAKSDSLLPINISRELAAKIEKFTTTIFETDDNDRKDPIQMLFKSEIYLYANLKEPNILQPLDSPISVIQTQELVLANISVKGIQFYDKFFRIRSKDSTIIKIGKSMTMELNTGKMNFKLADNLRDIVIDLDFCIHFLLEKSYEINGNQISSFNFDGSENFNIEEQKSLLSYYKKAVQVLDYLNIKGDIKISELTDTDKSNLTTLITAFIDKKAVNVALQESPLVFMQILNFKLLLLVYTPNQNNTDTVEIYDFFQMPDDMATIKDENGKQFFISQYIILTKDDYLEYSNTRYNSILTSFQRCYSDNNSIIIDSANKVLLNLLSTYDVSNEKKSEILCAAKELAEWLLKIQNTDPTIYQLNLLQTIRRERKFTKDEKEILLSIALNKQNSEQVLFGANLLLDNQDVAAKYFEQLSPTIQEEYKQYPIYKFCNSAKTPNT